MNLDELQGWADDISDAVEHIKIEVGQAKASHDLAKNLLDAIQSPAVHECLLAGMKQIEDKYGLHSEEMDDVLKAINELQPTR